MRPGKRPHWLGPIVACIGLITGIVGCRQALPGSHDAAAAKPSPAPRVLATLPTFVIENERAENTGLSDLRGSVWVADFIFTRCAGTCPVMTRRMAELEKELDSSASLRDVKLVSFSVDPDFDRPEVLRDYGRTNGAD